MATRRSDILLHPVRLRIVFAVAGDALTTNDIAQLLPDVPQATLYRHIGKLSDAGILDIVGERRARGAVERTFRVNEMYASIGAAEAEEMSPEEHLQAFTLFAGILIETYARYVKTPGSRPATDGVSFRQARVWLTDAELDDLVSDVTTTLAPYLSLEENQKRIPRLLSTILMPEPAPSRSNTSDEPETTSLESTSGPSRFAHLGAVEEPASSRDAEQHADDESRRI